MVAAAVGGRHRARGGGAHLFLLLVFVLLFLGGGWRRGGDAPAAAAFGLPLAQDPVKAEAAAGAGHEAPHLSRRLGAQHRSHRREVAAVAPQGCEGGTLG